jgi:hypothetical protein
LLRGRVSTCTLRYFIRGKPVLLAAIVDIKNLTLSARSDTRWDEMNSECDWWWSLMKWNAMPPKSNLVYNIGLYGFYPLGPIVSLCLWTCIRCLC